MAQIYHKRADTFTLSCVWRDAAGSPVNLSGYIIASQVRTETFVDNLVVTVTNAANGEFTVTRAASFTALWPITTYATNLFCDIEFSLTGTVVSSETFEIVVVQDITR
jgi:hypothetical protein